MVGRGDVVKPPTCVRRRCAKRADAEGGENGGMAIIACTCLLVVICVRTSVITGPAHPVRVIGSNSRCVKADIIPQHLPSADLGPYMRTHIETTAVGGRVR